MTVEGKVKYFNQEKGYGFIGAGVMGDHFFHITDVQGDVIPRVGDLAFFHPEPPKKEGGRPNAKNITIKQQTSNSRKNERPYYGKPTYEKAAGSRLGLGSIGGIIGAATLGPVGAIIGAIAGAYAGRDGEMVEITSPCLRCGGVGQVTSRAEGYIGFQCPQCKSFWRKRDSSKQ